MINKEGVQNALNGSISEKIICYEIEFRPSEIAKGMKKIEILQTNMDLL